MSQHHPRATIDEDLCVGTGDCVRIAQLAFELDDSAGVSRVLPTVSEASEDDLVDAATNCPTQAIRIFDEDGKDLV